ncbi:RagB/SusD family nutrient uptake outer membrane protein [Dyadobacter sp. Leaf189]|uniref:RagB/SusD family nutrient uptake outer membrane protein n=1 Tax=Dyadobacter sp. Leaf189 TaxID=1736295 RepID=UPI000701A4C3|nr:RagB/SusD family nutrient uptake outer membrane protein [Dyadobacter sp. Leaf189]KQS26619.1 carbohydrate-binding protein SusD [Dyadobacter sp. Leaf189]
MKIYIKKLATLALPVMLLGCADLAEKPVGLLAPEALFKTPKDVETAISGAYGWIASERLYGRQFVSALSLRDDMCDIGDRGTPAERQQVNDFNMDDNNNMVNQFWPYWYQVISATNAAIAGAQQLGLPDNEINPLIAEARFVRAFSYFHLVRVFGDVPYIDFFITNPAAVKQLTRTPAATVYAGILADLEFAKQNLPDQQPSNVRSRPSKGTAASYLAAVHLTLQDYAKAYAEAKWVIDNKDKFGYGLEADFQTLFRAPQANNLKEHIFAIDFLGLQSGDGGANDDIMAPMTGVRGGDAPRSGWSVIVPSQKVFDTWDARDYRKEVSFDDSLLIGGKLAPYTQFPNTKRPHIAKYARFAGTSNAEGRDSDHNYAAMRYAEILLIAAEAAAEVNGPTAEAIGYVNEVRARARNWAGKPTTFPADVAPGLTKQAFIDLVLEERRIELAFEYKRWYDIQRRKLGDVVFKGANSLEPHANFNAARDYLMPIPRVELQVNPNLAPQNPGY